ncbi:PREDICTED: uncharacterized protein LOC105458846 [Wasmannia auropunctata]|uniref:uncharacterized protein LOC105458846 n=1 Tax=Wasmannia auropunctata TaxID=64793 RepID=UPI0005EFA532|nr:PREDICTED: uncharacterized protein LOC105458846 [Wasmannia auropunctata]
MRRSWTLVAAIALAASGLVSGGIHEKKLLNDLLDSYNVLERPVGNESDPLVLSFGLTLMQIIDVVSAQLFFLQLLHPAADGEAIFPLSSPRAFYRAQQYLPAYPVMKMTLISDDMTHIRNLE